MDLSALSRRRRIAGSRPGRAVVGSLAPMRMSALFLRTLRDDPADAEVDSHRLLVRAGLHPPGSAGHLLLAAARHTGCCARSREIVRQEMDRAGAQEVSLPIAQPLELWERTGRDAAYGDLMFRLTDRKDTGVLPLADGRGGRHHAGRPGVRLLPRPAGEPLPDQLEVPRRDPAPLRPAARPRVPDEGRVLLRPRRRRPARRATG